MSAISRGIMTPAATQVSGSSTQHMGLEQLQRTCRKSIHLRNLQRQQTNILLCGKNYKGLSYDKIR